MSRLAERKKPKAAGRLRPCMTCQTMFVSTGAHHRMCDGCRVAAEDTSPYEPPFEWGTSLIGPMKIKRIHDDLEVSQ